VLGVLFGTLVMPALRAQARTGRTQTLLQIDLTGFCDGKEALLELVDAGPGTSGRHFHPGHSLTWVIDGTEVQRIDGQSPHTAHAGEVLHETPGQIHANENTAPVRLLTFRILEKGKPHSTRVE
jgi:quercetin dioxygenase-like cupin family protein